MSTRMSDIFEINIIINDVRQKLISEFIEDLKKRDNKNYCVFRIADETCEDCNNYIFCDDCSYPIIKKWEEYKFE